MSNPVIEKILKEGVQSLNVEMLTDDLKRRLLSDAGDKLFHMGHLEEAANTYAVANDVDKLRETGKWLLEQRKHAQAALFLRHVAGGQELERLAEECLRTGDVETAKDIYKNLGQNSMVLFLEQNFKE